MFAPSLLKIAEDTLALLRKKGLRLTAAESCTGGLITALLTEIAGSSDVVERGFVTYSNEAKHELLHVPGELIERHGAVSEQVARAMAEGALSHSRADIAIAVTGIAGPGGGSSDKPVGLVHFACAARSAETMQVREVFTNFNRSQVRERAVVRALELVRTQAERARLTP